MLISMAAPRCAGIGDPVVAESHEAISRGTPAQPGDTSSAAGQEAQGAFLFEVERAARGGGDAAEAAAEIRDGGPDRRLGQHPQAERQRRGADVVPALEFERDGDRLQVRLAELPVRRPG